MAINKILVNEKVLGFGTGLTLFFVFYFNIFNFSFSHNALTVAGIVLLMASFWVSMCIPIAITSLIPIVLFPIFNIMSSGHTVKYYANNSIYLFLGGFIIALAVEKSNLHKRLALHIASVMGNSPSLTIFGFMAGTALLSMWISNTATTIMMLPIGLAVIKEIEKDNKGFSIALMLAIAYSASIGGIATPIGTPPNIVFLGFLEKSAPTVKTITFFNWIKAFIPLTLILLPVVWLFLVKRFKVNSTKNTKGKEVIKQELANLGKMSKAETRVLTIFTITALLWIFRNNIKIGSFVIKGWSSLFSNPKNLHDATVAIFMAILLFIVPSGKGKEKLMDWETAKTLPWDILLLFGGGFAIAGGFSVSGLDKAIGHALEPYLVFHPLVIILIICLIVTFLTELTSNTATAAALMPIMYAAAVTLKINPLLLMIPTTISASMAFMFPVATPPNAIVFSSGKITMGEMARTGFILNILIATIVTVYVYFIVIPLIS